MTGLTDRQLAVLRAIVRQIEEHGYPPTIREIGEALDIRSTNGVNDHLKALERKGYLSRDPVKSRALIPTALARELLRPGPEPVAALQELPTAPRGTPTTQPSHDRTVIPFVPRGDRHGSRLVEVPIVGRVAAGQPILAEERIEDTVQVDSFFLGTTKKVYALRVQGDSMTGDGILPGDFIFVKKQLTADNGDIAVTMIDDEATVKRIFFEGDRVRLQPSNPRMTPIYLRQADFKNTMILGVVVGIYRKLS
jgi:repressor LexA